MTAAGFDPAAAPAERAPRARPGERAPRAPRETAKPRATTPAAAERRPAERAENPRAENPRAAGPGYGDQRREDRERAYAMNPDQPAAARAAMPGVPSALTAGRGPHVHGRPLPALLMKRKSAESEKV